MGKDLKGKNIGKGISQRKDGKYTARFTSKSGYRIEKHFISLNEAKNWLFEAQYEDKHSIAGKAPQMTVDEWFNFWITEYKEKTTRFKHRNGIPNRNSIYDVAINKISKKAGIEHFSMHTLRHTFATRAIEAGMKPKTLQEILGHSNIGITMNLYVHVTDEEKEKEMEKFELAFGIC